MNFRAQMVSFGTSKSLWSSVTVPITTAIFPLGLLRYGGPYSFPFMCWLSFDRDTGGLFTLDEISLLTTVWQKAESVLLPKNLKSYEVRLYYTYSDE